MGMIAPTGEQHRAIEDAGGEPVRVEDPGTKATYVQLRAEVYGRIRALLGADGLSPEEVAPLIWGVMREDWDDPAMHAYDHEPPRTSGVRCQPS